jgi:hypothetical protein
VTAPKTPYIPAIGETVTAAGLRTGQPITGAFRSLLVGMAAATVITAGGVRTFVDPDTIQPVTREA